VDTLADDMRISGNVMGQPQYVLVIAGEHMRSLVKMDDVEIVALADARGIEQRRRRLRASRRRDAHAADGGATT
jgi:hypothetical protein